MPPAQRYPRKGEFGDSTPRCEWCGTNVHNLSTLRDRNRGVWCSTSCSAAGQLIRNVAIMIVAFVALVVFLVVAFYPLGYLQSNGYMQEEVLFTMLVSIFLFSTMAIGGYYTRLGFKVRAGPILKKALESEKDFTDLHHKIVEFLKTFPANEGVSKKIVYNHLKVKDIPLNQINMAILELVSSGYVEELRMGRYLITTMKGY